MCLAETLLRVPDKRTADELIRDKLGRLGWNEERPGEGPLLLNAPTWGLLLTGKLVSWRDELTDDPLSLIKNLIARAGEPVVRAAVRQAMQIMARQFVVGETISEALANVEAARGAGYTHSFDMLGEAARTRSDADDYFNAYADAIRELGNVARAGDPYQNPGISIKLSALHPRYEPQKAAQVLQELLPRLHELARSASSRNLSLTIDAEESDRLMLSLRLFEELAKAADLQGWTGLGLAVQAYQKRALHVIDWLRVLASFHGCRIGVRLVKGAYWDTEIKVAQQNGVSDYPVFTRKAATDVSYLACARRLLAARSGIYPQFATHNIATFAAILELAGDTSGFEFQKLYGMGDALYQDVMEEQPLGVRCRVYAPVGRYRELMPYLVRRILENGANSSFVHRISDPSVPLESLVADPIAMVATPYVRNPNVPPPPRLFLDRNNSTTLDLADEIVQEEIAAAVARARQATPHPDTTQAPDHLRVVVEPCDTRRIVGSVSEAEDLLEEALFAAYGSADSWRLQAVDDRAVCLERAADLMEKRFRDLVVLCAREAGKTQPDAVAEVREAVDFCRYYAVRARRDLATVRLPGPTGEANALTYHGRGVFACISPWNFPLAIFTGQVSAALVAGNAVVAKPAEQTPLAASAAVAILHEAGVPGNVLRLVPGPGETTGARLVSDARIAGVVFTGSVETARAINAALAARPGPIIPFIAETGGQNAMIVDSSALPEQVVADVLTSAFQSAGQRCSSLRLLFLQQDIAPRVVKLLQGAMHELNLGDPALAGTDVGPVIDSEAKEHLLQYIGNLKRKGRLIAEAPLPHGLEHGHYVAPVAVEIGIEDIPSREVFGPGPARHAVRGRKTG